MTTLGELATANYVLVTTYRKNGTAVGTPVWAAADNDKLYVWTVTDSWKVKRIRNNPAVTVQPCDVRGKPHGEVRQGTATILDAAGTAQVRTLLCRKYRLTGPIAIAASLLRRGKGGTIGIEITPA